MLTWPFSLRTYALPINVEATNNIVTSSVCQVIAFLNKYLSKTSSVIITIDKNTSNLAFQDLTMSYTKINAIYQDENDHVLHVHEFSKKYEERWQEKQYS